MIIKDDSGKLIMLGVEYKNGDFVWEKGFPHRCPGGE